MNYKKNRKIFMWVFVISLAVVVYIVYLTPSSFEARRNIQNLKKIKLGMRKEDTLKIMGVPDKKRLSFLNSVDSIYYYKPPFGASDGIYIQFDKNNLVNDIVDVE